MTTPSRKLFVNLPVEDLDRSVAFFTALGFTFDPRFTDESATCMIIGSDAFAMLITRERFREFATRDISDAHAVTEVLTAVMVNSREEVDAMADAALISGGTPAAATQDHGWMYMRTFNDPDGHHWEVGWMDEGAIPPDGAPD